MTGDIRVYVVECLFLILMELDIVLGEMGIFHSFGQVAAIVILWKMKARM